MNTVVPIDDPIHHARYEPSFEQEIVSLPVVPATELKGEPPARRWTVEGLIPAATVTLLSGDGGVGKSLLALQLAVAVSAGRNWISREVEQGGALVFSAEDDRDELHRRLKGIVDREGIAWADLAELDLVPLVGSGATLVEVDPRRRRIAPTPLFRALQDRVAVKKPTLIVLDTAADTFGGDENARSEVRHFIGLLRGLAIQTGAAVVLLSHPSVSGIASRSGLSGSTAWSNSVRSRLYLDRVKSDDNAEVDPDRRVLKTMKSNYGRLGDEIGLRWDGGVFSTTDSNKPNAGVGAKDRAEAVFLELLDAYEAERRPVSPTPSVTFGPTLFAKDPRAQGIGNKALSAAMNRLFASNSIKVAEHGPPSRRYRKIVRC